MKKKSEGLLINLDSHANFVLFRTPRGPDQLLSGEPNHRFTWGRMSSCLRWRPQAIFRPRSYRPPIRDPACQRLRKLAWISSRDHFLLSWNRIADSQPFSRYPDWIRVEDWKSPSMRQTRTAAVKTLCSKGLPSRSLNCSLVSPTFFCAKWLLSNLIACHVSH